jgi:uncharacterized membrane protein
VTPGCWWEWNSSSTWLPRIGFAWPRPWTCAGWIAINTLPLGIRAFDPYPFGLLTMIVSLEAIFLSCFVLISQNRQGEKERVRSDIKYEINVKAELEVAHLHEKTDRIHVEMLERFLRLEKLLATGRMEAVALPLE